MTPLTIRAENTHKAMEELLRRLGPDALILSTRPVDGGVEIVALPPDADPVTTQPADFTRALQRETARPAALDPLAGLARRLLRSENLAEDPVTRLLIAGPPGSGKSLLAARLCAQVMLADGAARPQIVAPVSGIPLSEDRLRGWARLMGLSVRRPLIAEAMALTDPSPQGPQIVDLSDVAEDAASLTARLIETPGAELVLCLPAGLHPARIARICHDWQAFAPTVTLTGLDLWWPERAELQAIADAGLRLTRIASGTGLVRSLSRPVFADLQRWASGWASAATGAAG